MPPQSNNPTTHDETLPPQENLNSKRLEILVNGDYYDVTDFLPRHPGGAVLKYYTEKGEDATQAIQQFHNRSAKKVQAILKSFKKRPATDLDVVLGPTQFKRHQELSKDYAELFLEIEKEGLFKPSYWHVAWRFFELFLMSYITGVLIQSEHLGVQILACVIGGLTAGRAGYFVHECGHKAFTGNPKLDQFFESIVYGVHLGLSAHWWNRNHNRHHAMPQRLHHDIDLDTMPFVAYNAKVVKEAKQGKTFWIQNQVWLFMSIDAFLGVCAWRFLHAPKNVVKRRNYLDMFCMAVHWYIVYNYIGIWQIMLITWVGANYMYGNFALSHTHTPVTETTTHWVEYSLTHTVDVSHNIFVDWWMGWLNYQIEHHLFPTMPHFRAHKITDRVKALAKKHGLPFHIYTYPEAWGVTLKNMHDVAMEFSN